MPVWGHLELSLKVVVVTVLPPQSLWSPDLGGGGQIGDGPGDPDRDGDASDRRVPETAPGPGLALLRVRPQTVEFL